MKLETTLPERPGLLHAVPVMDIFALLTLFLMLGPSMLVQSGVSVSLPPSRFQLDRYDKSFVVTLSQSAGERHLYFGREPVTRDELRARLERLAQDDSAAKVVLILQTGAGTPVEWEREITEMALALRLRVVLAGSTENPSGGSWPR